MSTFTDGTAPSVTPGPDDGPGTPGSARVEAERGGADRPTPTATPTGPTPNAATLVVVARPDVARPRPRRPPRRVRSGCTRRSSAGSPPATPALSAGTPGGIRAFRRARRATCHGTRCRPPRLRLPLSQVRGGRTARADPARDPGRSSARWAIRARARTARSAPSPVRACRPGRRPATTGRGISGRSRIHRRTRSPPFRPGSSRLRRLRRLRRRARRPQRPRPRRCRPL